MISRVAFVLSSIFAIEVDAIDGCVLSRFFGRRRVDTGRKALLWHFLEDIQLSRYELRKMFQAEKNFDIQLDRN